MDTAAVREVLAKMSTGWKSQRMACQSSDKYYTHELVMNGPDGPRENILWTKEDCDGVAFLRNNAAAWMDKFDSLTRELAEVRRERDAANDVLRELASYVGAGGYNAPDPINPAEFLEKIRWGIDTIVAGVASAAQQRPTDQ